LKSAPVRDGGPEKARSARAVSRQVQRESAVLRKKYSGTSAEELVHRLNAMDVFSRAMLFAAVLLLCFFPFVIIVKAFAGTSAVDGLVRHLGLNRQAADIVGSLFTSSSATSGAVTGSSYVIFILGGVAAASGVQELYERAFDLESRGMKDLPRQVVWLAVVIAACFFGGWAGPYVDDAGGPVLLAVVAFVLFTLFWWFTAWFLVGGRRPLRDILPVAVATSLFWIGMEVVFSFTFSGMVISNHQKYGAIGVVFSLLSWLIAIGVVIVLGAVVGIVWRERQLRFAAALGRLGPRRPHRKPRSDDTKTFRGQQH
jgi:membrane protein